MAHTQNQTQEYPFPNQIITQCGTDPNSKLKVIRIGHGPMNYVYGEDKLISLLLNPSVPKINNGKTKLKNHGK